MQGNLESLEKVFFSYILDHPTFFHRIEAIAFKDPNIQFVYKRVRDHYLNKNIKTPIVPSNKTIVELVRLDDPQKKISNEFLEALLSVDVSEYTRNGDDWLKKKIQAWCTTTNIRSRFTDAAEYIRNLDQLDYENVEMVSSKIRELFANATLMNFDDEDLGLDFDDPDSHLQETNLNKIPTGWKSIDTLLAGGWDLKTLNVIIGASNSGKSLWLSNIAVNTADHGKNVLYVTLEMSDKKIMKRLGALRLKIDINKYDERSKDRKYIETKIKELKSRNAQTMHDSDLFENPQGKIIVKEYPAGSATIGDIDAHVKNIQEKKGIKIDMVVVDYLTIMKPDNNTGSLFSNGKQLSEGLRAIGQKHNCCMVTAMQVGKDAFGANDINLSDVSESKAIVETADNMFGIIRTEGMKEQHKYILKLLKLRDGDFQWSKTQFDMDPKFLKMQNDVKLQN